jgi:hypothetical protein
VGNEMRLRGRDCGVDNLYPFFMDLSIRRIRGKVPISSPFIEKSNAIVGVPDLHEAVYFILLPRVANQLQKIHV